jgi:hypothetical protein
MKAQIKRTMTQTSRSLQNSATADHVATVLLHDLIDYAGLFPPASLSIPQSVANYHAYSQSQWSWILGRFVIPVARLDEFEGAFVSLPTRVSEEGSENWRLSAILGNDAESDVDRIKEFNGHMARRSNAKAAVESVEVKVSNAQDIERLAAIIPPKLTTYFEIPISSAEECVAAVADCGRRTKIRTGGETADKIPAPEGVVKFIRRCADARVPFKATAGLHHPLRSVHRLTYQADSASGLMHGFINVFLTAAFLMAGMPADLAVQLLQEQSERAFRFDSSEITWREHRLTRDQIAATRRGFAVSFGSCSFTEPIDDLKSLSLL